MRASGVICEFNPFHNGHAYLLSRMRREVGEDGVVICLMSGRFVQRGEAAMADPYLRARMALAGGADLVLELPFPWSAASAEHFAFAGVEILSRLGIDTLAFGSECGDEAKLTAAARVIDSPAFGEIYAALCRRGMGTTAAYAEALKQAASAEGTTLTDDPPSSNDLLGIAYMRAILRRRAEGLCPPSPLVVTRLGSGYREDVLTEGVYPSATALRILLREAASDPHALSAMLAGTMPDGALDVLLDGIREESAPLWGERLMPFYHALYRLKSPDELAGVAEWGGGLAGHICRVAREAPTPEAFFDGLRTKQYTDARLRRALLFGALGVTEEDLRALPHFVSLLAATKRGCAYLKAWQRAHRDADEDFSVVTKPADAPKGHTRDLAERADALFTLCYPHPTSAGHLYTKTPFIQG